MPDTTVRDHLLHALEADLIGPFAAPGEGAPLEDEELLRLPPSRWYLTGFLAPSGARDPVDPESDEEMPGDVDDDLEAGDAAPEPEPKQKRWLPASIGLSVFVPSAEQASSLTARVQWADYHPEEREPGDEEHELPGVSQLWRRVPRGPFTVEVPLDAAVLAQGITIVPGEEVRLVGRIAAADAPGLPTGARALSLFVVNQRKPRKTLRDEAFVFQVGLELELEATTGGFLPRPDESGEDAAEWDLRVADLQFRDRFEWAVGHGVSTAAPEVVDQDGRARVLRIGTSWLPRERVLGVVTHEQDSVEAGMEALGALEDPEALRRALTALPDQYRRWIEHQETIDLEPASRRETRAELMRDARRAAARIEEGIELLAADAEARRAFNLANRAMATSALQRSPQRYADGTVPTWRLFQLAFLLLNVPSVVNEEHEDRERVELIFFPTGGGKTEAYLGVIAMTLVLRRLRGQQRPDRGLGVAVLLRYTLRLLTLDQLGRAATLICALEMLRRRDPTSLGSERFAVGLWVGRSATANTMKDAKKKVLAYRNSGRRDAESPFPLPDCPWCGARLRPDGLSLIPEEKKPSGVRAACSDFQCDFSPAENPDGLPVLFVDEQIYRELPCFLVATVDKFAMMPWRGETGMLFGRATHRSGGSFLGPLDAASAADESLPEGLRPPELIVQDEMHLISGPLGTMVGLYEIAIEELCSRRAGEGKDARVVRPKVLASTATVSRAQDQIRALFGRNRYALFPPPGIDDGETYFSRVDTESPGRIYVGVGAAGRSMKRILLSVYVALLAAAERAFDADGADDQTSDGYRTLVGYFNSLRELGGMRRLADDEVRSRLAREPRHPENLLGDHPWFASRDLRETVELTSRESTGSIARAKSRLATPVARKDAVDVLLASNMISVGVDIDRLGLMVVAGQPKTTSEYIQASSRVGRDARYPGLVVTCLNLHKARDRSHFERFPTYHASFYRAVEPTSLTPFSGPALERGLAGVLVAMARLLGPDLTPPREAGSISDHRQWAERATEALVERARLVAGDERVAEDLRRRARKRLETWEELARQAENGGGRLSYSRFDLDKTAGSPLLRMALDENLDPHGPEARFVAPTSMRDVEPTVHLWLQRRRLGATDLDAQAARVEARR